QTAPRAVPNPPSERPPTRTRGPASGAPEPLHADALAPLRAPPRPRAGADPHRAPARADWPVLRAGSGKLQRPRARPPARRVRGGPPRRPRPCRPLGRRRAPGRGRGGRAPPARAGRPHRHRRPRVGVDGPRADAGRGRDCGRPIRRRARAGPRRRRVRRGPVLVRAVAARRLRDRRARRRPPRPRRPRPRHPRPPPAAPRRPARARRHRLARLRHGLLRLARRPAPPARTRTARPPAKARPRRHVLLRPLPRRPRSRVPHRPRPVAPRPRRPPADPLALAARPAAHVPRVRPPLPPGRAGGGGHPAAV
ncbi:MAG: hypothetical protein AVDCRST_MAG64-469, partial [uncultured Phycisphaerae bacterium]